jgi:nephrocystin-3
MDTPTRTVRVFLSSTFRDFAEERNLLVKKVFPELRRKCRERQVELVDVDLRWGITEEEAQQGKVLPICLAEIDRSRPFFMGFLGERYGWVPEAGQYDRSLLLEQPWLEKNKYLGNKSVTELEILHGVLDNPAMEKRAFFYFRDPAWSEAQGGAYLAEGPAEQARLAELKERIRRSGFPVVEAYPDPEALAERVREDLWKLIDEAYPENEVPDALTRERMTHEAYGVSRRRLYLGGEAYFAYLDAAMADEPFRPVLVRGQSGGGKSALLANWVAGWSERHPATTVIVHHLGCGADAADPVKLATRLMREIARLTGDEFKPESDPEKQLEQLPLWLANASSWAQRIERELLLVLDGLDKVSDRQHLRWFPGFLPQGVKLVASCLDGEILAAAKTRLDWRELGVEPFTPQEQITFIAKYLGRYRKALTAAQSDTLLAHPLSGNPLFLLTVLEELRVFGVHEELEDRLRTLLSPPPGKLADEEPTVDDVFEHVLARIEEDLGRGGVQSAMESIWASRGGLYHDELLAIANLAPATWAAMQNALDEALYESGGRIQFGHDYLRKAVEDRYGLSGTGKVALHRRLAEWFADREVDGRVAEELPWQWREAEAREELVACLVDKGIFEHELRRDEYELLGYWLWTGEDIEAAYEAAWSGWVAELRSERANGLPRKLASFLKTAGKYWTFPENLYRHAIRMSVLAHGTEHPKTLKLMFELGDLFLHRKDDGFSEAFKTFKQVYESQRKELGEDHEDTLISAINLGYIFHNFRDFNKAEELFLNALRNSRSSHEDLSGIEISSMMALANTLEQRGDVESAKNYLRDAHEFSRKKFGENSMVHLISCLKLGGILRSNEGMRLMFIGLFWHAKTLGEDHPHSRLCESNFILRYGLYDLAKCWIRKGESDKAKELLLRHFEHNQGARIKAVEDEEFLSIRRWITSLPKSDN